MQCQDVDSVQTLCQQGTDWLCSSSAQVDISTTNAADALGMAQDSLAPATALMTNAGSEQDAHEGGDHLLWHDRDEPSVLPELP